jgi:uncharacterized membrane protein YqgA involved in biofilm formation
MLGTAINAGTVIAGSVVGVSIGSRLPERIRTTVLSGLGLIVSVIGLQMAFGSKNILIVLGSVLVGSMMGEVLRIEDGLTRLGAFLESILVKDNKGGAFGEGFVSASLIFCIGPMAILGSINDGLSGDYQLLAVKSALDGFAAIAFAASLGWGVLFSALSIFIYQGSITLFATVLERVLTEPMIAEMTATGGVIIVGIGLKLLNIKDIRLANFLPALAVAPLIVALIPVVKALL